MNESGFQPGAIRRLDDGFEGRIERTFDHGPDEVWRMLTEPKGLAQWLALGTIDLRMGGAVKIDFADSGTRIESSVRALEPLKLLEYSWSGPGEPERPLRWELNAVEQGTLLALTLKIPADGDIAKACAGFEGHLEMLAAALEGVPIHFPLELYLQARKAYQALLAK